MKAMIEVFYKDDATRVKLTASASFRNGSSSCICHASSRYQPEAGLCMHLRQKSVPHLHMTMLDGVGTTGHHLQAVHVLT
jgi:hypothetical protein